MPTRARGVGHHSRMTSARHHTSQNLKMFHGNNVETVNVLVHTTEVRSSKGKKEYEKRHPKDFFGGGEAKRELLNSYKRGEISSEPTNLVDTGARNLEEDPCNPNGIVKQEKFESSTFGDASNRKYSPESKMNVISKCPAIEQSVFSNGHDASDTKAQKFSSFEEDSLLSNSMETKKLVNAKNSRGNERTPEQVSELTNDDVEAKGISKTTIGGAVWDIFRREDVPKLIEYLRRHSNEFRHIKNRPISSVIHPIHDQTLFLNERHKKQLKEEFDVEPWTFEQYLGEAVFIPAGCPHQVRNKQSCIKVALDFVSPENVQECIRLTEEFRLLPKLHRAKEDKLEVKKLTLYAASAAIREVNELIPKIKGQKGHERAS